MALYELCVYEPKFGGGDARRGGSGGGGVAGGHADGGEALQEAEEVEGPIEPAGWGAEEEQGRKHW